MESVRQLQRQVLQECKRKAGEDLEFLAQSLTGHVVANDMKLGSYLTDVL